MVVVDGAQSIPHEKPNLKDLDVTFVFQVTKFLHLGNGVVYSNPNWNQLPPYQGGGDMIDQVSFKETSFAPSPQRFEAGTPNVAGVIGLGEKFSFISV